MMAADPSFLLRALQPAVQPAYVHAPAGGPRPPLEGQPFDALLAQARSGAIRSGRLVAQEAAAGEALEPAQLGRLAAAADLAEAAGARRVLVMIDGRGLLLDVPGRRLIEELSPANRRVAVDTALFVPLEDGGAAPGVRPPGGVPPRAAAQEIARAQARLAPTQH